MAEFSESLTIRILGESSQFQSELDHVADSVRRLSNELESITNLDQTLGRSLRNAGRTAINPLQSLSQILQRIQQQVEQLNGVTITLNVAPAIQALLQLERVAAAVQLRLMALSQVAATPRVPMPGPTAPPGPAFNPTPGPIRTFAQGGIVSGTRGRDRVRAMLTAGEFVVRRPAVEQMGIPALEQINRNGSNLFATQQIERAMMRPQGEGRHEKVSPLGFSTSGKIVREKTEAVTPKERTSSSMQAAKSVQNTVNHFGEVTIQVREAGGVNEIMRDLTLQGHRLRNRRG